MARDGQDAIAIVLDVGSMMGEAPEGQPTPLQNAIQMVDIFLQRKIFGESKDHAALFLFGSDVSENELDYTGIHMAFPLAPVGWGLCQYVQEEVQQGSEMGDLIDAIVVASKYLIKQTAKSKPFAKGTKRIMVLSSLNCRYSTGDLDQTIQELADNFIEINFIGSTLETDSRESGNPEQGPSTGPPRSGGGPPSQSHGKPKTQMQKHGEAVIRKIMKKLEDTVVYDYRDATAALMYFENKRKKPAPWYVDLRIGPSIRIAVVGFKKTSKVGLPTFKLCDARNSGWDATKTTDLNLNNDRETEVEKAETCSGYRYGLDLVPFSEEDKANMKYTAPERCLDSLGFTKASRVKRHHYSGDGTTVIFPKKGNTAAATAFSAVVQALYETGMVMVVRRVYNKNNAPRMGFLMPEIDSNRQVLHYVELPFMDDMRQFVFGSLPVKDTATVNKKYKPTDSQLHAVDKLIATMTVSSPDEGAGNESGGPSYDPEVTRNPTLQRLFQCLQQRVLHEEWALPPVPEALSQMFRPAGCGTSGLNAAVSGVKEAFKLEVTKKGKKGTESVFKSETSEAGGGGPKLEANSQSNKRPQDADDFAVDFKKSKLSKIGSVDPVKDFLALISDCTLQTFIEVCEEMMAMIRHFVIDLFGDRQYAQAMNCLKELRAQCVKRDASLFNKFLTDFKTTITEKERSDFWALIVKEQVSLIYREESESSAIDKADSTRFLQSAAEAEGDQVETQPMSEDEDDLLDAM